MPSTREIRRRIRSVRNTAQITKAMEMVSAVKMRRAQAAVLASRPYSERMGLLLASLAAHQPADSSHPLLQRRPLQRAALVLITADRGLCGSLNVNALRQAASFMLESSVPVSTITVGRRGRDWLVRHGRGEVIADFSGLGDRPTLLDTAPIARVVMDGYAERRFDAVYLVYNRFVSTTVQRVTQQQLLPIEPAREAGRHFAEYIFEPSPAAVLDQLLPRLVEVQIYQAVLESLASEHSARMVSMHNATQNAHEVIQELTLTYNKARQSGITKEILEIASGAEALQQA